VFAGIPLGLVRRYRNRLGAAAADGRAATGQPTRHSTA
jgi:hypothetical protein